MIDWNHLNSGELIFMDCQFFKDLLRCYKVDVLKYAMNKDCVFIIC